MTKLHSNQTDTSCTGKTCEIHTHCIRCDSINIDSQVFDKNYKCFDCKKRFTDYDIQCLQLGLVTERRNG